MTDKRKPILLWDIDGVIAPFGGDHALKLGTATTLAEQEQLTHELHITEWDHLYIKKDLKYKMRRLQEHFDFVWGTGWGGYNANLMVAPLLELPPLPAVEFDGHIPGVVKMTHEGPVWMDKSSPTPDYWKMPWIEKWAKEHGRPFLFIDDEMTDEAIEWAKLRNETIPTLFVRTDPNIGWIDDHEAQLVEWAEGVEDVGRADETRAKA